ncbi:hypothetical protein AAHB33_05565 [Paenarthrobacter sp. S56]|uniref:hypothetical protein n=1 Tax=Paenarthrobacter sp. S56 TaxID=3138179 RepID=UPI00321BAB55
MVTNEYRVGDNTYGPLELRSIWKRHKLRDFELRVILQVSGCDEVASRVLAGQTILPDEKSALEVANEIAKQKGYLPLFETTGVRVQITDDGSSELSLFLKSQEWTSRDQAQTRRI